MAAVTLQAVVNFATPHVTRCARMAVQRYGPPIAASAATAAATAVELSQKARLHVRRMAMENFDPVTESEYKVAVGESDDQDSLEGFLTDEERVVLESCRHDAKEEKTRPEPQAIKWCCQIIRASRNIIGMGPLEPIPLLSHWYIEVDGVYYELRENPKDGPPPARKDDGRILLHEEIGLQDRQIKLEVTTCRTPHPSTKISEIGTTVLSTEQIIRIASLIFRRFGPGYDLYIDNCQLFSQFLAEAIGGGQNQAQIRRVFEQKSVLRLPVAASWVTGPAYKFTALLHHIIEGGVAGGHACDKEWYCGECSMEALYGRVDGLLEEWERFHYHPRVYAARRETRREIEGVFERWNPFG